jgi:predicted DNA-binding transcriptional regulator AlpA
VLAETRADLAILNKSQSKIYILENGFLKLQNNNWGIIMDRSTIVMEVKMTNYLNKKELGKTLGVSQSTIQRKLKDFPKIKFGKYKNSRVLFPRPEIDDYIKKNFMVDNSSTSEGLS